MVNNAGRFQTFEFRFCNFKFFWIQPMGLCKNWGMTVRVNVMFHPIGWGGLHITCAQNGGEFLSKSFTLSGTESGIFCVAEWNENKRLNSGQNVGQRHFGGGWGRCRSSKQYLAGLWSNSDSQLSQEINAQNRTCHCGLQNLAVNSLP
jgi:hypothetical protein